MWMGIRMGTLEHSRLPTIRDSRSTPPYIPWPMVFRWVITIRSSSYTIRPRPAAAQAGSAGCQELEIWIGSTRGRQGLSRRLWLC
jgi:hypothetical protein